MRLKQFFSVLLMLLTVNITAVWGDVTYTLVTAVSDVTTGDKVIVATKTNDAPSTGVTGWNGTKDATVSTTESEWVQFEVTAVTDGWNLYDATAKKYIKSPGSSNQFLYDATNKGVCSVDNEGVLKCNNRYLVKNNSYYRMYATIQNTYVKFYVWKVTSEGGSGESAVKSLPYLG